MEDSIICIFFYLQKFLPCYLYCTFPRTYPCSSFLRVTRRCWPQYLLKRDFIFLLKLEIHCFSRWRFFCLFVSFPPWKSCVKLVKEIYSMLYFKLNFIDIFVWGMICLTDTEARLFIIVVLYVWNHLNWFYILVRLA